MTAHRPVEGLLRPEDIAQAQKLSIRRGSLPEITAQVSEMTGIAVKDLMGRSRIPHISHARFLIWYIAHREGMTLHQIARVFGLNHSSIQHGIKFERRRRGEPETLARKL